MKSQLQTSHLYLAADSLTQHFPRPLLKCPVLSLCLLLPGHVFQPEFLGCTCSHYTKTCYYKQGITF